MKNTNGTTDRRIRRTKESLNDALFSLIQEKRYDKITVREITDRADIGRSTFYDHFQDKDDLLLSQMDEFRLQDTSKNPAGTQNNENWHTYLSAVELFAHIGEHKHLYEALLGESGINLLTKAVYESLRNNVEENISYLFISNNQDPQLLSLLANFIAGALLRLLFWYLDESMPYTPEEMDEIFQKLIYRGIEGFFQEIH